MPYLFATFITQRGALTIDAIIDRIRDAIPAARITDNDWYQKRRRREQETFAAMDLAGTPVPVEYQAMMLESIDRAQNEHGPAKEIQLPNTATSNLIGRISLALILLHCDEAIDSRIAGNLESVFHSLGILERFEISE